MSLRTTVIRRLTLFGAFTIFTSRALAQTPSPALVVTVRNAKALAIVDPQAMKVAGIVPVGDGFPHEVAVSADGKLAFVTVNPKTTVGGAAEAPHGGYAISVIDLAARKELRRVEIGPSSIPHGIVFAGGKLYYTAEGYRLVGCYDPASNEIDWMQGTGQIRTHMLVVTKDTNKIFAANTSSNTVTAMVKGELPSDYQHVSYDSPPAWNVTQIPAGSGPEGIAISPDEKEVWVAGRNDGGLSIIDVASKKVIQTLNVQSPGPSSPAFTPDGKRVIIADNSKGDVLVLDAFTRKVIKRMVNVGHEPHGVLVAPDGLHAYVAIEGSNNIVVIDMKKLEVTGSIVTGDSPEKMAWAEGR